MSLPDLCCAIECLLFASNKPVSEAKLAEVLGVAEQRIAVLIDQLQQRLEDGGLCLVELAGGYNLATRPEYADFVEQLLEPEPERLSVAALETVAIIAYRQPITRPEIDQLRGVNSSGVVNTLMEKGLVEVAGRKNAAGRPFLLKTTRHFLASFGLRDLDELPRLAELEGRELAQGLVPARSASAATGQAAGTSREEDLPSPANEAEQV